MALSPKNARNRDYYAKNSARVQERNALWMKNNPEKILLNRARQRARYDGLECTITVSDIEIVPTCPYLNTPLEIGVNMSIDRIDSSRGYVPGNVQVISTLANRMKNNATVEQLLAFAAGVLAVHGRLN